MKLDFGINENISRGLDSLKDAYEVLSYSDDEITDKPKKLDMSGQSLYFEDEDSGLGMDDLQVSFNSSCNMSENSDYSDFTVLSEPEVEFSPPRKRQKTQTGSVNIPENRTSPMTTLISAVDRLSTDSNLIADGTRTHGLPTINGGKHKDLMAITPETMSDVIEGKYRELFDHVTIIDCRYPYEYNGGHVKGAVNLYTKDAIQNFLNTTHTSFDKNHVVIFHCEFSSERGPKMCRFLRGLDRDLNKDSYPSLNFPELYLLEGGYKDFFYTNKTLCEPQTYKPMLHKEHKDDLRHFRVKSKSWSAGDKHRPRNRMNGGTRLAF